jgi:hypothetical protein
MLDSIGNDKNIMAISHPPCLHVWFIVKCSMGGPPEAKCRLCDHVVFCYTLLWEDLSSTNYYRMLHYVFGDIDTCLIISASTSVIGLHGSRGIRQAKKDMN